MTIRGPITVDGPVGGEALLFYAMNGREELGRPFSYELQLLSQRADVEAAEMLGRPMTVHLELPSGELRHFSGIVTRFGRAGGVGSHEQYSATLRPTLWLLTRTTNCRVFQRMTVPEIVASVFRDHGFSDYEASLSESYAAREYSVQYRETDFAFVSRLLEEEGIYYFFRHEAERHVLVLADAQPAHRAVRGHEVVPYLSPTDARTAQLEYLERWRVTNDLESGAWAMTDFDFERPGASLLVHSADRNGVPHGELELFDYPGRFLDRERGESYARIRLEQLQAHSTQVVAEGNVRALGVGDLFTLRDHPREDQNREYVIVGSSYRLKTQSYESQSGGAVETEDVFRSSLLLMDQRRRFRPRHSTPKPLVSGPQTAIVVGPEGEEIWTDNYARIKVRFHWNRFDRGDENSSCWVRVAQASAGNHWGALFVPRVGQEVVVDFLEGDPDRPLVTGAVYNGDNAPPYDLPGAATQSGLRSRSTPRGAASNFNEIRFEDAKGREQLSVQAEKDLEVLVKNDETARIVANRRASVGSNDSLAVGGARDATIQEDDLLSIRGNRTKLISGSEFVSIECNQTSVILCDRTAQISGSEETVIDGARTETVGSDENLSIGGARSQSIGKDETLMIAGKRLQTVDQDDQLKVSKRLVIDVGEELVLKSGDASLTLKSNGDVIISGARVMVDGSGAIKIKAGEDLVLKGSKIGQN